MFDDLVFEDGRLEGDAEEVVAHRVLLWGRPLPSGDGRAWQLAATLNGRASGLTAAW